MSRWVTLLAFSALSAVLAGCQTHQIGQDVGESAVRLAELRARAARGSALVKRVDSSEWMTGMIFEMGADSVRLRDELGRSFSLHRANVEAVRFERRKEGMLGWSVVGLSAGALIGLTRGDDQEEWWKVSELYLGAAAGGAVGLAMGSRYGLPVTYRLGSP